MRCSFSEPLLDAYVEGQLTPLQRARVARHLASCERCSGLLEELRVIDALLIAPRHIETAPNFTFAVMAEVRSMPPPRAAHVSPGAVLAAYVVFGWITIGAFLLFARSAAEAAFAGASGTFREFGATLSVLSNATGHLFGRQTFDVTATMGVILAADLVIAVAFITLYPMLRGRRAVAEGSTEPC